MQPPTNLRLLRKKILALNKILSSKGLDSFLISSVSNIFYLIQKKPEGYLFLSSNTPIFFTDFRYQQELKPICKEIGFNLYIYGNKPFQEISREILKNKPEKIGFEAKNLTCAEFNEFNTCLKEKAELIPTYDLVERLRMIKEKEEINLIKKSVEITKEAFSFAESIISEGLSEKFIAQELERFLKLKGDIEVAFRPVVASGISSAEPHYSKLNRRIKSKEVILIDSGSKYKGYSADLTRVLFLDKMPVSISKILDIVKKAKELAIRKIKEGVKISEVDRAARSYIQEKGYGKYFGHSLGHGVGIDVHEIPSINSINEDVLQENIIITVEPAIYLPGRFGIREESMVLVKKNKAEVLDA